MATEEKSRDAFEPKKRYAAVGMQLGRVLVDDDFNEAERIRIEEEREVNLDVIGPVGTPDDGFKIVNGSVSGQKINFDIAAGTLYLGGLRVWNPHAVKYLLQPDWLQQGTGDQPTLVNNRVDLVYLEAWQQPVTAVEDSELFEVALGGPDTSDRLRTMWRVHVATGVAGDDCPDAWATVVSGWTADALGTVDANAERVVDTKLQVTYTAGVPGDLCTPAIAAGYLGAENQTIRVQLRDDSTLTWGLDNAAPVYRATLSKGPNPADRTVLTLATFPRDEVHWPTAGQIVEILPWSAVLYNNEKLAEEVGHLARVETSYDPTTHKLVIADADAPPSGFGEAWTTRSDAGALGTEYVFVRVWNRGDDQLSPLSIPYTPGTPVDLTNTGLRVTITGTSFVTGDHWVIAARPKTPTEVVPWELEAGRRVHGTRRFYAPLALIRWNANGTFELLHDCRPFFLPLTRLRGCCTYTVGDEVSSFGQFKKIQDAINALPAEGGKVCVLPGTYEELVLLWNRHDVTIEGCGPRSRIRPPARVPWNVVVVGGHDITIRDLAVECGDAFGVVLFNATKSGNQPTALSDAAFGDFGRGLARIRLENLTIRARGRSAILSVGGFDVIIRGCEILAGPLENVIVPGSDLGKWPAIFSFANDLVVEDNRILASNESASLPGAQTGGGQLTFTRTAMGGIQIGGGSRRIDIRRNLIEGGNGDGVTLGSWAWVQDPNTAPDEQDDNWNWWDSITITINEEGCIEIDWDPQPGNPGEEDWVALSMGDVFDVTITDNRIRRMGKGGVGVTRFFDLREADQIIAVHGLAIHDNRIEKCLRLPIPEVPENLGQFAAQGVITLAEVDALTMHGNELRDNGRRHTDPVCGVFAMVSTGVVIEHNAIVDNAPFIATNEPVRPGWRGGVVLPHAIAPSTLYALPGTGTAPIPIRRQSGEPGVRICDNVIVVPEGRCITIVGQGPMSIGDNHLTTRGPALADFAQIQSGNGQMPGTLIGFLDALGGIAVLVFNAGQSNESNSQQIISYGELADQDMEPRPGLDRRPPTAASGNVLFEGNHVNVDLLRAPGSLILSTVALVSRDDVMAESNAIEVDRGDDQILMTLVAQAVSARVQGNRVKESFLDLPLYYNGLSIFSQGVINMINGNQTTRCIAGIGVLNLIAANQTMLDVWFPARDLCADAAGMAVDVSDVRFKGRPGKEAVHPTHKAMYAAFDLGDGMMRSQAREALRYQAARTANATRELARTRATAKHDGAAIAAAEARRAERAAGLDRANVAAARAAIPAVQPPTDAAVVHGLVTDRNGHLARGLDVRVVDRAGHVVGKATTDTRGYFRLTLGGGQDPGDVRTVVAATGAGTVPLGTRPPADAAGAAGTAGGGRGLDQTPSLTLEIADGERVVFRDRKPQRFKVGKHLYREIHLIE